MTPNVARDMAAQLQEDLDAYVAVAGADDDSPAIQKAHTLQSELAEV